MCANNDPLDQTPYSPASSDHYSQLKMVLFYYEKWGRTEVQTPRAKIVTTTGRVDQLEMAIKRFMPPKCIS